MAIFLILISPAVGSFLALVADRLMRGESLVIGGSACRSCATRLGWRELIPLLSYLLQRGRCRTCAAPIPVLLPLAEVGAVSAALGGAAAAHTEAQMLLGALWLWCLLGLALCDAHWFRLPDLLTGSLLIFGLALAWEDPARSLTGALLAGGAGAGAFLAVRLIYQRLRGREGLGLGDVKLMAGLGAGLGAALLPVTVLIAALGALLWAVWCTLRSDTTLSGQSALPFGAFLCGAAALVWMAHAGGFVSPGMPGTG